MDKRRPDNRNSYTGRFGDSADVGNRRPTGSYRSRPAGSYRSREGYAQSHRAAQRSGGDSYTRRPAPQPAPQPRPKKKARGRGWRSALIAIAAVAIAALLLVLLFGGGEPVIHQLPTIEPI